MVVVVLSFMFFFCLTLNWYPSFEELLLLKDLVQDLWGHECVAQIVQSKCSCQHNELVLGLKWMILEITCKDKFLFSYTLTNLRVSHVWYFSAVSSWTRDTEKVLVGFSEENLLLTRQWSHAGTDKEGGGVAQDLRELVSVSVRPGHLEWTDRTRLNNWQLSLLDH